MYLSRASRQGALPIQLASPQQQLAGWRRTYRLVFFLFLHMSNTEVCVFSDDKLKIFQAFKKATPVPLSVNILTRSGCYLRGW